MLPFSGSETENFLKIRKKDPSKTHGASHLRGISLNALRAQQGAQFAVCALGYINVLNIAGMVELADTYV